MTAPIDRYPLTWPVGWKRTPAWERLRATFSGTSVSSGPLGRTKQKRAVTVSEGVNRLQHELELLGAGSVAQAFAGYAALPPARHDVPASDWWTALGVHPNATLDEVEAAFRALTLKAHPDRGGSHDQMANLTDARRRAREALRSRP